MAENKSLFPNMQKSTAELIKETYNEAIEDIRQYILCNTSEIYSIDKIRKLKK